MAQWIGTPRHTRAWPTTVGWLIGIVGAALTWPAVIVLALGAFLPAFGLLLASFGLGACALACGVFALRDARRFRRHNYGAVLAVFVLAALDVTVAVACAWYARSIIAVLL